MRPLEGIMVLDLSQLLSGPTCTNMLRLLGAEVVKIERPHAGDPFRDYTEHSGPPGFSMPFASCNAGKKSITLDYAKPEAREVIRRLAARADIVVENFRPGVTQKHGLDWPALSAVNPRLVYCSITGFGQNGPLRDWGALDQVIQAISGLLYMNGNPGDGPVKVGFPVMDTFTGYLAVIAILAALRRRDATGAGEFVDVAMLDSAMRLMGAPVATTRFSGRAPARIGTGGYRRVATAEQYESADGRYLSIGAQSQPQFEALCHVLGCSALIADPRFASHAARVENSEPLREGLAAAFKRHNGPEIERALAVARVPVGMVRDLLEMSSHPQLAARDAYVEAEIPGLAEPVSIMGAGFKLMGEPFCGGAVPAIGAHTDQVMAEIGFAGPEIAALRARGVV